MNTAERIAELERQNEVLRMALQEVYSAFGIGEQARSPGILMSNLRNVIEFTEMLHAIEREFFMVPGEPDEDFPDEEPQDECLVNSWGSTVREYVEQFRAALALKAKEACEAERASWDLTCSAQALEIEHLREQANASPTAADAGGQHSSSRIGSDKGPCSCGTDRTAAVGAEGRDYETRHAIMEAECNAATEEYFKARPQLDFIGNRRIFESGFQRGFERRPTANSAAHQEGVNLATQGMEGQ